MNVLGDGRDLRGVGLVVVTPAVQVNGNLALGVGSPRRATTGGLGALSSGEIEAIQKQRCQQCL